MFDRLKRIRKSETKQQKKSRTSGTKEENDSKGTVRCNQGLHNRTRCSQCGANPIFSQRISSQWIVSRPRVQFREAVPIPLTAPGDAFERKAFYQKHKKRSDATRTRLSDSLAKHADASLALTFESLRAGTRNRRENDTKINLNFSRIKMFVIEG